MPLAANAQKSYFQSQIAEWERREETIWTLESGFLCSAPSPLRTASFVRCLPSSITAGVFFNIQSLYFRFSHLHSQQIDWFMDSCTRSLGWSISASLLSHHSIPNMLHSIDWYELEWGRGPIPINPERRDQHRNGTGRNSTAKGTLLFTKFSARNWKPQNVENCLACFPCLFCNQ